MKKKVSSLKSNQMIVFMAVFFSFAQFYAKAGPPLPNLLDPDTSNPGGEGSDGEENSVRNTTRSPIRIRPLKNNQKQIEIVWPEVSGKFYRLQYSDSLLSPNWIDNMDVSYINTERRAVSSDNVDRRFFRLFEPLLLYGDPKFNGNTMLQFEKGTFERYKRAELINALETRFFNADLEIEIRFMYREDGTWQYDIYTGDGVGMVDESPFHAFSKSPEPYSAFNVVTSMREIDEWINENADTIPLNDTQKYETLIYGDFNFNRSSFASLRFYSYSWNRDRLLLDNTIPGEFEVIISIYKHNLGWRAEIYSNAVQNVMEGDTAREVLTLLDVEISKLFSDFTAGNPWHSQGVIYVNGVRYTKFEDTGGCHNNHNVAYYSEISDLTLEFWGKNRRHNVHVLRGRGRNGICNFVVNRDGRHGNLTINEIVGLHPSNITGTAALLEELQAWIASPYKQPMQIDVEILADTRIRITARNFKNLLWYLNGSSVPSVPEGLDRVIFTTSKSRSVRTVRLVATDQGVRSETIFLVVLGNP